MDELTTFSRKLLISILASLRPPENGRAEPVGKASSDTDEKSDEPEANEEGGPR